MKLVWKNEKSSNFLVPIQDEHTKREFKTWSYFTYKKEPMDLDGKLTPGYALTLCTINGRAIFMGHASKLTILKSYAERLLPILRAEPA